MDKRKDWIFIEGLETRCVIGIFDWERRIKQKVLIDLKLQTDARRAAKRDRVEDTVNYKQVAKRILQEAQKSRFELVESLAELIARILLREFKFREVTVRISKPGAIRGARNVGIQITRRK
jgi:dihydroneopterin aldolase